MAKRRKYLYLSLIALAVGLCVYVIFKENSYLHLMAERLLGVSFGLHTDCEFVNYHLCDFLWAFSLTCGLIFILGPERRPVCAGIASLYGLAWEVLQQYGIVSGTGDWLDVQIYLLASLLAVIIFRKKGE